MIDESEIELERAQIKMLEDKVWFRDNLESLRKEYKIGYVLSMRKAFLHTILQLMAFLFVLESLKS